MIQEKDYDKLYNVLYSEITGEQLQKAHSHIFKNQKISRGLNESLKRIGRPSNISESMIEKAYVVWQQKKKTQKEIAREWGVSERTVRRKFKKISEKN